MDDHRADDLLIKKEQSIIIVDDDIDILQLFHKKIDYLFPTCKIKSFDIINQDFFTYIENNIIDLFVLDVRLGSCNAIELSKKILLKKPDSIFLFISGFEYNIDSFSHLKGKCIYDYMSKPFTAEIFVGSIVTLLNISTTYKLLRNEREELDEIRKFYVDILKKDKIMIDEMKIETQKLQEKKNSCFI